MLADETDEWVEIPTCHFISSNDHYIHWSMCGYNLCHEGHSKLFDQGAGGILPREKQVVTELSEVIWDTIRSIPVPAID